MMALLGEKDLGHQYPNCSFVCDVGECAVG